MTVLRSFIFELASYLWTTLGCVVSLPALVVSRRATVWICQLWGTSSFLLQRLIVGRSYEVRGRHLPKGTVIVAVKHQSAWDTIALCDVLHTRPASTESHWRTCHGLLKRTHKLQPTLKLH